MLRSRRLSSSTTRIGGALALLVFALSSRAVTLEEYLRQVETEAKRLAATPVMTKAATLPGTLDATTERLPLGLLQSDFEKAMREQFVGTYVFYQRLNSEDKRKIYELYKQDNQVSTLREETLKLLSSSTH
jgi:hypothetical protein